MPQEIRKAGCDPVTDEAMVLSILRDPGAMITPKYARGLCSTVLMVAYTHKVTLEAFVDLLNNVSTIQSILSRLEGGAQMLMLLHDTDPQREPATLNTEIEKLAKEWVCQKGLLADQLAAMMECPTAADPIN
jgi:hypothetical protein